MKKFIIITLLMLFMPIALSAPDVYDQLRGRQMVGDAGAPWFADDATMYFGTDKDAYLRWDAAAAMLRLSGALGPVKQKSLSKTANYTVLDTDPDLIFVGALSAHATITLPTAADNAGRTICAVLAGDPGAYNVIVDGEGSETINGATTKTNSDQYSSITVRCDGTGWYITSSSGTWT